MELKLSGSEYFWKSKGYLTDLLLDMDIYVQNFYILYKAQNLKHETSFLHWPYDNSHSPTYMWLDHDTSWNVNFLFKQSSDLTDEKGEF